MKPKEMTRNKLLKLLENHDDIEFMLVDGHDNSAIGISDQIGVQPKVVYNIQKIIENLMSKQGMSEEDAWDYYYYNIVGSYVGEGTPIFIDLF